jgi:ferredoxin
VKVRIDPAKCQGHKQCNEICPELYKLDEWGYALVEQEVVPHGLEERARAGAGACPSHAIVVEEG